MKTLGFEPIELKSSQKTKNKKMKIIFFFLKSCELGSKVQKKVKKSINIILNTIELSSKMVHKKFTKQIKMQINLMQKRHDEITQLFIDGEISIKTYFFLDDLFYKTADLYTINLN